MVYPFYPAIIVCINSIQIKPYCFRNLIQVFEISALTTRNVSYMASPTRQSILANHLLEPDFDHERMGILLVVLLVIIHARTVTRGCWFLRISSDRISLHGLVSSIADRRMSIYSQNVSTNILDFVKIEKRAWNMSIPSRLVLESSFMRFY